jgi:hypothetical protein
MGSRASRASVGELLELTGLCDRTWARRVAEVAGRFPAVTERNMFLEYELGNRPVLAGLGLGFGPGVLSRYALTRHSFYRTPTGRAVDAALADDPFAADRAAYLDLLQDPDPDWIEYDVDEKQISLQPFVFFRPPSRFLTIATRKQTRSLCRIIPGASATGEFARLLNALIALTPARIYRVGLARQRGQGWWRGIIAALSRDQVVAALRSQGATGFERTLDLMRDFYRVRADTPGSQFSLSVDVEGDRITAIDVECPYLFRIGDISARKSAFKELLAHRPAVGTISPRTASWLSKYCCKEVVSSESSRRLRVMVHHLKFRFLGSPHLRTKAYLHLGISAQPAQRTKA